MFSLTKEADRIYLLTFDSKYDLCMTFLRYQEYYESDNPRFQYKNFTLVSFMHWYTKTREYFSYIEDWAGFNLPISIIDEVRSVGIPDPNHYDALMQGVVGYIKDDAQNDRCYLIGVSKEGISAYNHEMAHGLFYVNKEYNKEVKELVSNLPENIFEKLSKTIQNKGYAESSVVDEIQAYIVSGSIKYIWKGNKPKALQQFIKDLKYINSKYSTV